MKKFFLNLLSSFLGAWLAFLLFAGVTVLVVFAIIGTFAVSGSSTPSLKSKSVMAIDLSGVITETESDPELSYAQFVMGGISQPQTLKTLTSALREAADNDKIKALYLKCGEVSTSPATLHALYEAVAAFKESKKPIYAYGDEMSQGAYYIASLADSIFLNPQGNISITGVGGSSLYYKNLCDKIGIEFQIAKVGAFKSAVEPYLLNEMSEPARAQLDTLYGNIWSVLKSDMAQARNMPDSTFDALADNCSLFFNSKSILKSGIISGLCYEREMDPKFAKLLDVDKDDLNYVDPAYVASLADSASKSDDHIAVLYATGEISESSEAGINCFDLVPVILDLAEDDNVKGLVLRVNSPGGSVFGAEQIADALKEFKKTGKPFVVSMGDYAASGGYWISADADQIYADPITITGSIGIFGVVPNMSKLLSNIGVSVQSVSTNNNGNVAVPLAPLTEKQMATLNASIIDGYDQFINRVAKGRNMPETKVRLIAEGRVWDGTKAKELGLVDQLGSLRDAVKYVASKTKLSSDDVCYYPEYTPSLLGMLSAFGSEALDQQLIKAAGDEIAPQYLKRIKTIITRKPAQAIMPEIIISL
jgi:protease-4